MKLSKQYGHITFELKFILGIRHQTWDEVEYGVYLLYLGRAIRCSRNRISNG